MSWQVPRPAFDRSSRGGARTRDRRTQASLQFSTPAIGPRACVVHVPSRREMGALSPAAKAVSTRTWNRNWKRLKVKWNRARYVGMPSDEYARRLTELIEASKKEAGWDFPWFVARVSYHNPSHPSHPNTRAAQKKLWDEGVALEGPDTDTLMGDNRDNGGQGIHFSGKGNTAHGIMLADKVSAYLDKVLKKG